MFNIILLKVMEQQKHIKRTSPVVYITTEIKNEIITYYQPLIVTELVNNNWETYD